MRPEDPHDPGEAEADAPRAPDPQVSRETEIKLSLASAADAARLAVALPPPERLVTQVNLFLDTPDRALGRARWALRLRLEREDVPAREEALLALKGPAERFGGAVHRVDVEAPLPAERFHAARRDGVLPLADLTGPAADLAREHLPTGALLTVVTRFENLRAVHRVDLAGSPRELLLDRTRYATGEEDHEVEVELALPGPLGSPEAHLAILALRRELDGLLAAAGVTAAPPVGGKFSRALAYQQRARGR